MAANCWVYDEGHLRFVCLLWSALATTVRERLWEYIYLFASGFAVSLVLVKHSSWVGVGGWLFTIFPAYSHNWARLTGEVQSTGGKEMMVLVNKTNTRSMASFSRTVWVNRHQKVKPVWIFMKQRQLGGSGISWTIRNSFSPRSRQIPGNHTSTSPLNF